MRLRTGTIPPDKSTLGFYYKTFTFGHSDCGPTCVIPAVPRVWPASIAPSNNFPAASTSNNPPTKASQASSVSTISSSLRALTAHTLTPSELRSGQ